MVAYGYENVRVRIEIRAPRSVWNALTADDVQAYVDVSDAPTGTVTLPVQVEVAASPVQVIAVAPAEATFSLEPIAERTVTITADVEGQPLFGYRAHPPDVVPQSVRVRGPASWVEQVESAEVTVSVQGQQTDVRDDYTPLILDEEREPVPNVGVSPKMVTVLVPIEQLGYIRDLPVTVPRKGQPAPGYTVANLVVIPPVVTVFGSTEVVRSAPPYLQTQPVVLEAITQSLTTTVALQMPEGLSVITPPHPSVTVSLSIAAIQSGLTLDVTPEIRGLDTGLTAEAGIASVVVVLSGPLVTMEQLEVEDVVLILDVTNLAAGEYNIEPHVEVPVQVTIENIIPERVPVKIKPFAPTPEPFR
jgi:YbbR domain-containing protein